MGCLACDWLYIAKRSGSLLDNGVGIAEEKIMYQREREMN